MVMSIFIRFMLHGLLLITLSYTRLRLSNVLLFDTILFYNEYLYRPILTNYYNMNNLGRGT